MNEKQIQDKLHNLSKEKWALYSELRLAQGRRLISCQRCDRKSRVNKLTYIQTYWYVQPHGCTAGDYWNMGEGQYECPKCEFLNRLYDRDDVVNLKASFKEVVETHER